MNRLRVCRFPGCHRAGVLVRLPFFDRYVWVCDRHRGAALIAAMRELVPHG